MAVLFKNQLIERFNSAERQETGRHSYNEQIIKYMYTPGSKNE